MADEYEILESSDTQRWNEYLQRFPAEKQDINFKPEYYKLFESFGKGKAICFVYEKNNEIALYPFLINSVNELGYDLNKPYFDIQGAYGFNGVLSSSKDLNFIESFSQQFNSFCTENNIIAEFTRFNPVLKNQIFANYLNPIYQNSVINIDLSIPKDKIWMESYSSDIRRNIRNGNKMGYQEKIILLGQATDKDINDVISIYYTTLNRNSAEKEYYFDRDFVFNMRKWLPENVLLGIVEWNKEVKAGAIVPFCGFSGYGLMGGSLPSINKASSFAYLIHNINIKLKELNVTNFLLGGGKTPNDSIFQFKKGFSRHSCLDFFIAKKIHNENIYAKVTRQWEMDHPAIQQKYQNILLKYRSFT